MSPVDMNVAEAAPAHSTHANDCLSCMPWKDVYNKFIHVNESKCALLNERTKGQSESSVWRYARRLQLPGSTSHKVPSYPTTNPDHVLREQIYPSFGGNHATEHGKRSEPKGLQAARGVSPRDFKLCSSQPTWPHTWSQGPVLQGQQQFTGKLKTAGLCHVAVTDGRTVLQKKWRRGSADHVLHRS